MKNLAAILGMGIVIVAALASTRPVFAAVRCETQYGGGETCVRTGELQIDKEVRDPDTGNWVDNLGLTSHRFFNGDEVVFRLRIKNTGDERFSKVEVSDTLPSHLELVSGDLNFEISDLDPGEEEIREIKTRVKNVSEDEVVCEVNAAEVEANSEHDRDTSQVCMGKKVLGVTTLPSTGAAETGAMLGFGLISTLAGLVLVKATR